MTLQSGKSIISGWSDGKIRAFAPQSGKLLYTIHDAHHKAVTSIAPTSDSSKVRPCIKLILLANACILVLSSWFWLISSLCPLPMHTEPESCFSCTSVAIVP